MGAPSGGSPRGHVTRSLCPVEARGASCLCPGNWGQLRVAALLALSSARLPPGPWLPFFHPNIRVPVLKIAAWEETAKTGPVRVGEISAPAGVQGAGQARGGTRRGGRHCCPCSLLQFTSCPFVGGAARMAINTSSSGPSHPPQLLFFSYEQGGQRPKLGPSHCFSILRERRLRESSLPVNQPVTPPLSPGTAATWPQDNGSTPAGEACPTSRLRRK